MIAFNDVSVLSYSHSPKFLGENDFNYSVEKTISINGYIYNFSFFDGVSGVISGLNGLVHASNKTGDIYINGSNIGRGFVNNLQVNNGNWVRYADYSAEIKILDTGNLFNLTGKYFSGIDKNFLIDNLYAIEDISESFNFSIDSAASYSYDRNLEISFNKAFEYDGAQVTAQAIASHIFTTIVPFNIFTGINIFDVKKYYQESYDIISKKYSFKEQIKKLKNSNELVDAIYSYNISRDQDGVIEIIESVEIESFNKNNIFSGALAKLNFVKANSFANCSGVLSGYINLGNSLLNTIPISQGYDMNQFEGKISVESIYSNNIANTSGYSWSIQRDASLSSQGESQISVMLNINGYGPFNTNIKFNNAKNGLNEKKALMSGKANDFYQIGFSGLQDNLCKSTKNLWLKSEQTSSSYYRGTIDYSLSYSDKELPLQTDDYYELITESETPSILEYANYYISNQAVRQAYPQTSLGEKTIKSVRKYKKPVDFFTGMMPPNINIGGTGEGIYITDDSISYAFPSRRIERSITYNYHNDSN
jgi:hypothetical protein